MEHGYAFGMGRREEYNFMIYISFIMSIYNTPLEWIDRAVDSILGQTSSEWELIIVDDGSKKEVAEYCDELSNKDSRIKIKHQENKGLSVARNYGMDTALGKYVAFIDADDWIVKDYVEKIKGILDKQQFEILSFGHCDVQNEKVTTYLWGNELVHTFDVSERKGMQMSLLQTPEGLSHYPMFFGAQWNMVYSLEFLNKYGIRNTPGLYKAQDSVFNLYVTEKAEKIGYYNESLYCYFINDQSVVRSYSSNLERFQKLIIAYKQFIDEFDKGEEYKEAYEYNAIVQFEAMLSRYFFNEKNTDKLSVRHNKMRNLLLEEPYKELLENISMNNKTGYKKMMITAMKHNNYGAIRILYILKNKLKR